MCTLTGEVRCHTAIIKWQAFTRLNCSGQKFTLLMCVDSRTLDAGIDPPRKRDLEFEEVIVSTIKEMGLTAEDDFVLRVVQFSELLAIRHCVFLMGPTGTGRTECYRVLAKAITKGSNNPVNDYLKMTNKKKVIIRDINPKSISTYELYGQVNQVTYTANRFFP